MSLAGRILAERAKAHTLQLVESVSAAEAVIVATVERECEALRAGQFLAAEALHLRLRDAARLYLAAARAVRGSLWTIENVLPGSLAALEERRSAFGAVLKVELAVLAAARRQAGASGSASFSHVPPSRATAQAAPVAHPMPSAPGPARYVPQVRRTPPSLRVARS